MRRTLCVAMALVLALAFGVLVQAENLLIYTSCPIEIMTSIEQAFEEANPDIDLEVYRSGTGTVTAKIATELEAGNVLADLVWVADYAYYESLKELDLVDPDGYYYGARLFAMVIVYNTTLVADPPRRWTDLLDPLWEGQVVSGNPQYSGSNVVTSVALGMRYGLSYFEQLRANGAAIVRGNSQAAAEVAAGAYQVGFTLDNMVRNLKAEGSPVDLVYPEDGAVLLPSPIAIVNTTDSPDAAKKFVDYVLSPAGQQALVDYGSYVPVRSEVAPPLGAPTLQEITDLAIDLDIQFLIDNKTFFTDHFVRIMLEE
jgi:iron(III) transport system substrate-binding protein